MTGEQIFPSPQALSLTRNPKNQRIFIIAQLVLRVLVPLFTLAATIAILKSDQTYKFEFGMSIRASYTYSSAIRYQLITVIVVGVSCLLSLLFVYLFTRPNWNINNYFYIFLFDLVLLLLITSACAAGTSVGMIARNGESKIGWSSICGLFPKFCHKVTLAIVFSYSALSCMLILTTTTASKLPNWNINKYSYIFLFDLVLLLLITSACTAGTSVGMIALYGESKIGWSSVCGQFPKFCFKVTLAIVFSYSALPCMLILTIITASKLRS